MPAVATTGTAGCIAAFASGVPLGALPGGSWWLPFAADGAAGYEFSYTADGTVISGDLQQLDIEIHLATGIVRPAED